MLSNFTNSKLLWSVLVIEGFGTVLLLLILTGSVIWSSVERS